MQSNSQIDPWADDDDPPPASRDPTEAILSHLDDAQRSFARARFMMGATLLQVREHELWRGKARSFAEYLEERRIHSSAAYQYMRVVDTFFHELTLTPKQTFALELVPMRLLDRAAKVITPGTADLIIAVVSTLRERDAQVWLDEFSEAEAEQPAAVHRNVTRLIAQYRQLADDQRIEFIQRLQFHKHGQTR